MRIRTEGITWQEIDGELVVLDLKTSAYLTTNVAGALLVKQLTEEREEQDLVDALVAEFDIDVELARADVASYLTQLREKSMLIE
ncbi:PqqD family protein [Microbacterium profundi]|uniref:PqqD family protein n=1 Tax=Microbacterium profundi TaxID=450380 RepID=UPI001F39C84B|nr:PqqD family protein [Microbacterium profundi]MCE7481984.1 PqqD family protein [Microbacterium profundi]